MIYFSLGDARQEKQYDPEWLPAKWLPSWHFMKTTVYQWSEKLQSRMGYQSEPEHPFYEKNN